MKSLGCLGSLLIGLAVVFVGLVLLATFAPGLLNDYLEPAFVRDLRGIGRDALDWIGGQADKVLK